MLIVLTTKLAALEDDEVGDVAVETFGDLGEVAFLAGVEFERANTGFLGVDLEEGAEVPEGVYPSSWDCHPAT